MWTRQRLRAAEVVKLQRSARRMFEARKRGRGASGNGGGKRARGRGGRVMRRGRGRNARIGGFLGIENKFVDGEVTAEAMATTWTAHDITTTNAVPIPAIGNTESTRIGRVYHINSLHLKGQLSTAALESNGGPLTDIQVRICVVWDTQTNGAQLTATDVMDGGQTLDVLSFRNLQFSKRFRILMDRNIIIKRNSQTNEGAINLFAAPNTKLKWSFNKRFKTPVKVICSGTTGVVGSVTDNSFHVIGVSTSTEALIEYQARIRFQG